VSLVSVYMSYLPSCPADDGATPISPLCPLEPPFSVPADNAVGRVSSELLCPYPPGVPLLFPGERITAGALAALRATLAAGGAVTGARDGTLATLQVVVARQPL
jgi:hypothetical protein